MRERYKKGKIITLYNCNQSKDFEINELVGEGASCLVYDAIFYDDYYIPHNVRLKQCYPLGMIKGINNGSVIWNDDVSKKISFEAFEKMYKKQIRFQNDPVFSNSTGKITDSMYDGYNTKFIVLDYDEATTYDKDQTQILYNMVKTSIALTTLVKKYHDKNFLILDLKPQNFMVIPETNELVYLIDFDSVKSKKELESGIIDAISYSNDWAAPELQQLRIKKIDFQTDIYSIGAILYNKIFNCKVTENERRVGFRIDMDNDYLSNTNPKVKFILQDIITQTISNNPKRRYKNCDKLLEDLKELERLTVPNSMYLESSIPLQDNYFIGRIHELNKIDDEFDNGKQVIYINGYGGIGKTELAKKYCLSRQEKFHTIVWLDYKGNIDSLIGSDRFFAIANYSNENRVDYLSDKKRALKLLCDSQTLIVLDNYDEFNSDIKDLLTLGAKVLVTTRLAVNDIIDDSQSSLIKLGSMIEDDSYKAFRHYYSAEVSLKEKECIKKIIKFVDGHSMTVALIAKYLSYSDTSPSVLLDKLISENLNATKDIEIKHSKDNDIVNNDVLTHVKSMLDISDLSEDKRRVMYIINLLGDINISKKDLGLYAGLISNSDKIIEHDIFGSDYLRAFNKYKENVNVNPINQLIEYGWLEYDSRSNMVSCHNIIRDVVNTECRFSYEQMPMFKYLLTKIIYKLYKDTLNENSLIYLDVDDSIDTDFLLWDEMYRDEYEYLVMQVLMRKYSYTQSDIIFISTIMKYVVVYSTEEFADFYISWLGLPIGDESQADILVKVDATISAFVAFVVASKRYYWGGRNKYNDNDYLKKQVDMVLNVAIGMSIELDDEMILFKSYEMLLVQYYILDGLGFLRNDDDNTLKMYYIRDALEYLEIYQKLLSSNLVMKEKYVYPLKIKRDIFTYNINVVIINYAKEIENTMNLTKEEKVKYENKKMDEKIKNSPFYGDDDGMVVEYDDSIYKEISNEDKDIKKDFLHNVYDYTFNLLLCSDVRLWYKESQLSISSKNNFISVNHDFINDKYDVGNLYVDKDYLVANMFLTKIGYGSGISRFDPQLILEYYLEENWYMVFKIFFYWIDNYYSVMEEYEPEGFGLASSHLTQLSQFQIAEIFLAFGNPEVGVEISRLLSINYYNEYNYNKFGKNDDRFGIDGFINHYIKYATYSHDKTALYRAYNHKKELTGISFYYDKFEDDKIDLDTEKMWVEIRSLFNSIDELNSKIEAEELIRSINSNIYIPDKYKKKLVSAVTMPITLLNMESFEEELKQRDILYCSDEALKYCINKLKRKNKNDVEKIIYYSEICYQYCIKQNDSLLEKYLKKLTEVVLNINDYNGKFNYIAIIAVERGVSVLSRINNNLLKDYVRKMLIYLNNYIDSNIDQFDYYLTELCMVNVFELLKDELFVFDEETLKKRHTVERIEKYTDLQKYLVKSWIGENHIVNEFRDANADNKGRLDNGVYTLKRKREYIKKANTIVKTWRHEEHSAEEYQAKFTSIFDEVFPINKDYISIDEYSSLLAKKHMEAFDNMIKKNRESGKRHIIKNDDGTLTEFNF